MIAICSRPEEKSDVLSGTLVGSVVPDNRVKIGDPTFNSFSQKFNLKPPKAAFSSFFSLSFRQKRDSDVISSKSVGLVCLDVAVKLDDSRSNRSRDIRLPPFVSSDSDNDDDNKDNDTGRRTL